MPTLSKRFISLLSLGLLLALSLHIPAAKAHVLKSDNSVSGILHIQPDDNAVAAKPTDLYVLFSTTGSSFSLNDYHLQLKVVEDGSTKSTMTMKPAYFGSSSEAATTVTFPIPAVYDVLVSGQPLPSSNAPAFHLDYVVRVTGNGAAAATVQNGSTMPVVVIGSLVAICLLMLAIKNIQAGGRYRALPAPDKSVKTGV